jgi:hypothetical protein
VNAYQECEHCIIYMTVRRPVLLPAMARVIAKTGETGQEILDRYMAGVHKRHLAGLPIMPRKTNPMLGRVAALMATIHKATEPTP